MSTEKKQKRKQKDKEAKADDDDWRGDVEYALAQVEWEAGEIDWETASPKTLIKQIDAEIERLRIAYNKVKSKIPVG